MIRQKRENIENLFLSLSTSALNKHVCEPLPHITQIFDYVPILPTNFCKFPRRGSIIGLHLAIPDKIILTPRIGDQMWILSFPGNMEIISACAHGHPPSTVSWDWAKFLQRRKEKCNVSREGRRTPTIWEVISSTSPPLLLRN